MNCKFCGEIIDEGAAFCTNCGAKIEAQYSEGVNEQVNSENAQSFNNSYYNGYENPQENYSQQYNNGYSQYNPEFQGNAPWYPPVNDKAASVKDYLKWMLLYPLWTLVPCVGFLIYIVVCFKYAFDDSFKARSNFFKAMLITMAVSIGIAVAVFIFMFTVLGTFMVSEFSGFEELYPEIYHEFMDGYNTMRIFFGR